jgi:MFS transporter, DHA2 family, multidrug resistance protein
MAENPQQPETGSVFRPLGLLAVLLGAMIATFFGRLLAVGAADLRGAMHLDYDAATWISTVFGMGLMFIGPFSVYLGGVLGPRRVLLASALLFTPLSAAMPLVGHFPVLLALLALGGLSVGTFYPLTLSFLLRNLKQEHTTYGIAAYAADIVFSTHVAHSYEAWLMSDLSWRWIFWTSSILSALMAALIYFGIPQQPLPQPKPGERAPNWRGFLYASLGAALLYGALDQGLHLDWWRSGTFVGMVAAGLFLVGAAVVRHFYLPNPLIDFPFVGRWNTMFLAVVLFLFRFLLLGSVLVLPAYLSAIRGYTAEQIGPVLLWLAIPQLLAGLLAVYLLGRIDARVILATGAALIAIGCIMDAGLTSEWAGSNFYTSQLVLATGEGLAFNGLVGSLILDVMNSGIMTKPIQLLTFAGFFQTVRLLGGETGSSFMQYFLQTREQLHSNLLGLHVQRGAAPVTERAQGLAVAMFPQAPSSDFALGRVAELLGLTVRQQAYTLAITDCFWIIAFSALVCLLAVASVRSLDIQYKHVIAAARGQKT